MKHLLALHCLSSFSIYNFILNRSVNKHKCFWNGCCLLCMIFKHWKLKAIGHVETFLRSALLYKSLHLKFNHNNFTSDILMLRVS